MAAALSMNSSAQRVDLPTVEKMITAMETRMQEKYDRMVEELKERLRKAISEKNELEKKLEEMQIVLARACEMLELEPPVTFQEYMRGISDELPQQAAVSNCVSNGNEAHQVVNDKAAVEVKVEQGSIIPASFDQGQDAVDSAAPPLMSFGEQKILFRYEKEPVGMDLDAPSVQVRMFTGKYLLKMKGEEIPVRMVLVRENAAVDVGPKPIYASICFPMKPGTEEKPFYDPLTLRMVFVDAVGAEIATKQFVVEPGNGYCTLSEASDKKHWDCEGGTYWIDDFFEVGSDAHARIQDKGFLRKVFVEENQQAFYMKANVEFFSAPSNSVPPAVVNQVEELDEPPYEIIELTEKMASAIREWEKSPTVRHIWYADVDLNLDLICYGDQKGNRRLVTQCVQNLAKLEKKAPYFTVQQINRMIDVAELYDVPALKDY